MGGYISRPGALAPLPSPATTLWLPTYHAKPEKRRERRRRRERSRRSAARGHRSRGRRRRLRRRRGLALHCYISTWQRLTLHCYPMFSATTVSPTITSLLAIVHVHHERYHVLLLRKGKGNAFRCHRAPGTHAHEQWPLRSDTGPPWLGNAYAGAPAPTCSPQPHPTMVRLHFGGSRMVDVEKPHR